MLVETTVTSYPQPETNAAGLGFTEQLPLARSPWFATRIGSDLLSQHTHLKTRWNAATAPWLAAEDHTG